MLILEKRQQGVNYFAKRLYLTTRNSWKVWNEAVSLNPNFNSGMHFSKRQFTFI